jgi:hypothetical protein
VNNYTLNTFPKNEKYTIKNQYIYEYLYNYTNYKKVLKGKHLATPYYHFRGIGKNLNHKTHNNEVSSNNIMFLKSNMKKFYTYINKNYYKRFKNQKYPCTYILPYFFYKNVYTYNLSGIIDKQLFFYQNKNIEKNKSRGNLRAYVKPIEIHKTFIKEELLSNLASTKYDFLSTKFRNNKNNVIGIFCKNNYNNLTLNKHYVNSRKNFKLLNENTLLVGNNYVYNKLLYNNSIKTRKIQKKNLEIVDKTNKLTETHRHLIFNTLGYYGNIYTILFFLKNPFFIKTLFLGKEKNLIVAGNYLNSLGSYLENLNLLKQANINNIIPGKNFSLVFFKKVYSSINRKKLNINFTCSLNNTLVRFMEYISGKKVLLQFYPFINQSITKN